MNYSLINSICRIYTPKVLESIVDKRYKRAFDLIRRRTRFEGGFEEIAVEEFLKAALGILWSRHVYVECWYDLG